MPDHYLEIEGSPTHDLYSIYPDSCYHWYYENNLQRFRFKDGLLTEESLSLPDFEDVAKHSGLNMSICVKGSEQYKFNEDLTLSLLLDQKGDGSIITHGYYNCVFM